MHAKRFTIFQPSYPAGIDWGHPLAQGLVAYVIGSHQYPVDLVSGRVGVPTSPTTARARDFYDGRALDVSGSLGARFDFGYRASDAILTGPVSGLFSGQFGATGIQMPMGVNGGSGVALEGSPLLFYTSSAGTRPGFLRANSGGGFSWWNSGVAFTTGRPIRYAFSQNSADPSTTPVFWQDGAFTTPANDGVAATSAAHTTNSQLRIGQRATGDRQFVGFFGMGAMWGRYLTPRDLMVIGEAPYSILRRSAWRRSRATTAANYTMAADTGAFTLTGVDAGLTAARTIGADTGSFTLTGVDVGLEYGGAAAPTAGGLPRRKKRKARDATEGNRDFLGSRRNSRPGVAEEEMREVLATVKAKAVPIPLDAIEDDDEEAILWLI